jgi:hypothetical protein
MWPNSHPLVISKIINLGVLNGSYALLLKYRVIKETPANSAQMELDEVSITLTGLTFFIIKFYPKNLGPASVKRLGLSGNSV